MLVIGTFIMNFNVITPLYAAEILGEEFMVMAS